MVDGPCRFRERVPDPDSTTIFEGMSFELVQLREDGGPFNAVVQEDVSERRVYVQSLGCLKGRGTARGDAVNKK